MKRLILFAAVAAAIASGTNIAAAAGLYVFRLVTWKPGTRG